MQCRKKGCRAYAMRNDSHCYFHNSRSDAVEKRRRARQRGGSGGKTLKSDPIDSIEDVRKILAETINGIR